MKLFLRAVLIGLVGLGFAAPGAQAAGYGSTGSDSGRSAVDQVQPAGKPATSTVVRGVPKSRRGTPAVAPAANVPATVTEPRVVESWRNSRRNGEVRRSRSQQPVVIVYNQTSSVADEVALADYVNQEVQGYYQPGYDWGAAVKGNQVDSAEFVPYLQQYIVVASPVGRDAFRQGFINGFGGTAETIYDRALRQACQRSGGLSIPADEYASN
jgi:hypothetical protein